MGYSPNVVTTKALRESFLTKDEIKSTKSKLSVKTGDTYISVSNKSENTI